MPVGQHHHLFLPAYAVRGFQVDGVGLREVVVSFARLVLYVARQYLFIGESGCQSFGIRQVTSAVVSYVYNQSVADG